jgi:hypothetical protein
LKLIFSLLYIIAYNKEYYELNNGKIRQQHKDYYELNKEKILLQKKQYRAENKEKRKANNEKLLLLKQQQLEADLLFFC